MRRESVSPRLVRTKSAAAYIAESSCTLRRKAQMGLIPYVEDPPGSPWKFDIQDLDAYIEAHKHGYVKTQDKDY